MTESEKTTRKKKIDSKLTSSLLSWKVIPWSNDLDTDSLTAHAVEEYPTKTGPADYAMFVNGKLLGVIEAKKLSVGAKNVLEQAKRYSKSVARTVGEWRGYKVPFLYSTNGEVIFYLDVRKKENTSYQISDFHSPQALSDKFSRNTAAAELWFQNNPVNKIKRLRYYQEEAIEAIEYALIDGKKKILLAMATGTGKIFTIVSLIYRLLKSGYAKKILFLVDRRALAAQAVSAISAFETPERVKLDNDYEVYSQKFRSEDLDESMRFNPSVLPEDYLVNPQEKHTFIYVSTIQRMAVNLLNREGLDGFEYNVDAGKLDIPINVFDVIITDECHRGYFTKETGTWKRTLDYFDAVKIGLTATSAGHTMAMFTHKISSYSTEQAVLDGFLVDYDAVKIKSSVKINGAFLKEGELVGEVDTQTGVKTLDALEDEREFSAREIEARITAPDSTNKIIKTLKKHIDRFEEEYGRFPKTLIFAVNDLPHISHSDEIVRTCKDIFGKGDVYTK